LKGVPASGLYDLEVEAQAMHRADITCAECHRKIDPLGFSLESFDPTGRWRTKYPVPAKSKASANKIDSSGEFPSGETYEDFIARYRKTG